MEGYMFLHFSYLHKSRHLINNKSEPQNSTNQHFFIITGKKSD